MATDIFMLADILPITGNICGQYPNILAEIWPITIQPISRVADTITNTDMANTDIQFADTDISV